MDLKPCHDEDPGYPTIKEYRSSRRSYLRRMAKAIGAVAVSGMGILSFGEKKKKNTDTSAVVPAEKEPMRLTGEAPAPEPVKKTGIVKAPEPQPKKIGEVKAPDPAPDTAKHETPRLPGKVKMTNPASEAAPRLKGRVAAPQSGAVGSRCSVDTTVKKDSCNVSGPPPTGGVPPPVTYPADDDTIGRKVRGKPMAPQPEPPPPIPGSMRAPEPMPKKPVPPVQPCVPVIAPDSAKR